MSVVSCLTPTDKTILKISNVLSYVLKCVIW